MNKSLFRINLLNRCSTAADFADSAVSAATTAFIGYPKQTFQQAYDLAKSACQLAQTCAEALKAAARPVDLTDEEWTAIENVDEAVSGLTTLDELIEYAVYGSDGNGETEFDDAYEEELETLGKPLNGGAELRETA